MRRMAEKASPSSTQDGNRSSASTATLAVGEGRRVRGQLIVGDGRRLRAAPLARPRRENRRNQAAAAVSRGRRRRRRRRRREAGVGNKSVPRSAAETAAAAAAALPWAAAPVAVTEFCGAAADEREGKEEQGIHENHEAEQPHMRRRKVVRSRRAGPPHAGPRCPPAVACQGRRQQHCSQHIYSHREIVGRRYLTLLPSVVCLRKVAGRCIYIAADLNLKKKRFRWCQPEREGRRQSRRRPQAPLRPGTTSFCFGLQISSRFQRSWNRSKILRTENFRIFQQKVVSSSASPMKRTTTSILLPSCSPASAVFSHLLAAGVGAGVAAVLL